MEEKNFNFLQEHSLKYLEMAFRKDKQEAISNPDGYRKRTGECGDTVEFFLIIKDNLIEKASYLANGCLNTNACACATACFAEKQTVEKAWEISPDKIAEYLESLPKEEIHCAELAVGALYLALRDAQSNKLNRYYRKI